LSTDNKKNMRFLLFFSIFFTLEFLLAEEDSGDWRKRIWRSLVAIDFESGSYGQKDWRFRGPRDQNLPDIYTTKNITAPLPGSRRALLFRFNEGNNIAGQFIFPEPIEFRDYLKELIIPVYSSKSGGSLSLILQSHDYENTKLFLTQLNYRGWRTIHLPVSSRLNQNDPVLDSRLVTRLIGILYEPGPEVPYGTEILVGIDDITAIVRTKYKVLREPESLLE